MAWCSWNTKKGHAGLRKCCQSGVGLQGWLVHTSDGVLVESVYLTASRLSVCLSVRPSVTVCPSATFLSAVQPYDVAGPPGTNDPVCTFRPSVTVCPSVECLCTVQPYDVAGPPDARESAAISSEDEQLHTLHVVFRRVVKQRQVADHVWTGSVQEAPSAKKQVCVS
jgi:hypothetical protein